MQPVTPEVVGYSERPDRPQPELGFVGRSGHDVNQRLLPEPVVRAVPNGVHDRYGTLKSPAKSSDKVGRLSRIRPRRGFHARTSRRSTAFSNG